MPDRRSNQPSSRTAFTRFDGSFELTPRAPRLAGRGFRSEDELRAVDARWRRQAERGDDLFGAAGAGVVVLQPHPQADDVAVSGLDAELATCARMSYERVSFSRLCSQGIVSAARNDRRRAHSPGVASLSRRARSLEVARRPRARSTSTTYSAKRTSACSAGSASPTSCAETTADALRDLCADDLRMNSFGVHRLRRGRRPSAPPPTSCRRRAARRARSARAARSLRSTRRGCRRGAARAPRSASRRGA